MGKSRVQRFLSKPLVEHHFSPEDPFNPNYLIPERIIDEDDLVVDGAVHKMYLVKWSSQGYDEATWEDREDLVANITDEATQQVLASNDLGMLVHFVEDTETYVFLCFPDDLVAEFHRRRMPAMVNMHPHQWQSRQNMAYFKKITQVPISKLSSI